MFFLAFFLVISCNLPLGREVALLSIMAWYSSSWEMSTVVDNSGSNSSTVVETFDSISRVQVKQPWALNNTALKWLRDTNEVDGNPVTPVVPLTNMDPLEIGVLDRGKGMAYQFLPGQLQPWSWREMLASFKEDMRRQILGDGDDGLVSISCEASIGSYDHKRHHAAKVAGNPYKEDASVPVWDFVVQRASGTSVRFHPHQTNKKVDIASVANPPPREHPNKGRGKSDGPGTYRRFTRLAYPGMPTVVEQPPGAAVNTTPAVAGSDNTGPAPPGLYYVRNISGPMPSASSSSAATSSSQWYSSNDDWRSWQGWNSWESWGGNK